MDRQWLRRPVVLPEVWRGPRTRRRDDGFPIESDLRPGFTIGFFRQSESVGASGPRQSRHFGICPGHRQGTDGPASRSGVQQQDGSDDRTEVLNALKASLGISD